MFYQPCRFECFSDGVFDLTRVSSIICNVREGNFDEWPMLWWSRLEDMCFYTSAAASCSSGVVAVTGSMSFIHELLLWRFEVESFRLNRQDYTPNMRRGRAFGRRMLKTQDLAVVEDIAEFDPYPGAVSELDRSAWEVDAQIRDYVRSLNANTGQK